MIVRMLKIYLAARRRDRERLLEQLRELGVVHLVPVDPAKALPDDDCVRQIDRLSRAVQVLSAVAAQAGAAAPQLVAQRPSPVPGSVGPSTSAAAEGGRVPGPCPTGFQPAGTQEHCGTGFQPVGTQVENRCHIRAEEVLAIERRAMELKNQLAQLHREAEEAAVWGDLEFHRLEELRASGVDVRFYCVPQDAVAQVQGECVVELRPLPGRRRMVAAVNRLPSDTGFQPSVTAQVEIPVRTAPGAELPDVMEPLVLPRRDAPQIRAETSRIDSTLKRDARRLAELAPLRDEVAAEVLRLRQQADFTVALRGAADAEQLFAVQGWIPAESAPLLPQRLAEAGIEAVTHTLEPAPDEQPPTLIRRPGWAQPIEGLFRLLGTVPGYREFDVSIPFMLALPIFAAILISDGGYGGLLLLGPLLAWGPATRAIGPQFTKLLIVIGAVAVIWGLLTASFFGFTLYTPLIPANLGEESRVLLMRMSFWMGAIHLSIAQLWQAIAFFPDLRFLSKVGWATFIWGMLGVAQMFVLGDHFGWDAPWPYLLTAGGTLAILFAYPSRNVLKMVVFGIGSFPLSMLSAFSDVISYVRLMAVGLASTVLAASFNEIALGMGFWPLEAAVLVLGHGLTFSLGLIALFAHGVRLNMLEFSSNLGMQWTGYPFSPFQRRLLQEAQS